MIFTSRSSRRAASLPFTQWSKSGFFCPAGATQCPDKVEIWHGGRSAPPCQISPLSGQKCRNTFLKLSKFVILPTNSPLRGDSFA